MKTITMQKKKIYLLGFLLMLASSVFALTGNKVNIGLRLAPSVTWLDINNPQISRDGAKVKLNGGLHVYFNLTDNYAITTGANFNTYGGRLEGISPLTPDAQVSYAHVEKISYNFHEVELPAALKLRTNAFGNLRYAAQLGLAAGIVVGGKATKADVYKSQNFGYTIFPIRALYNVGIGIEYDLNGTTLTGGLNYKGWISNLFFYDAKTTSRNLDLQTPVSTHTYENKVIFRPSAVELVLGVMF